MFLEAIVAGRPVPGQVEDITTGLSRFRVLDRNPLHWHRDPRFSHFTTEDEEDSREAAASSLDDMEDAESTILNRIEATDSVAAASQILLRPFTRRLEALLQLPQDSIGSGEDSFADLGVDSLVAVEIRSWIWKTVGRDVPVLKILGAQSISRRESCLPLLHRLLADLRYDGN
jgi:hypothetical protein